MIVIDNKKGIKKVLSAINKNSLNKRILFVLDGICDDLTSIVTHNDKVTLTKTNVEVMIDNKTFVPYLQQVRYDYIIFNTFNPEKFAEVFTMLAKMNNADIYLYTEKQ